MNARSRRPLRGGNWNNSSNAGLGALNLNNSRSNSNSNIGFRPALEDARCNDFTESCLCHIEKDAPSSPIGETKKQAVDASIACAFDEIISFESLLNAAYACRKGKQQSPAAIKFFDHLEENVIELHNDLVWGSYRVSPYQHFYVFEPKRRLISAPAFRDRVVHRAIYNVIEREFDKRYIFDSYACRNGKGAHSGANRAQGFIRKTLRNRGKVFALKADIKHYFSSIDHSVLKTLLANSIRCEKLVCLLFYIIDSSPNDGVGKGIPLGNLTSQLFANIYLHELDLFVKHELSAKHYVRYMDDFVIISDNKERLHVQRERIVGFLGESLALSLNSKTQIFPVASKNGRSLDFLGYRVTANCKRLRKCSVKRIKAKLRRLRRQYAKGEVSLSEINQHINSWLGHASHANAQALTKKLLKQPFRRDYV